MEKIKEFMKGWAWSHKNNSKNGAYWRQRSQRCGISRKYKRGKDGWSS